MRPQNLSFVKRQGFSFERHTYRVYAFGISKFAYRLLLSSFHHRVSA